MKLTSKKLNFVTCTTDFESLLLTTGHGSQHVQQLASYPGLIKIRAWYPLFVHVLVFHAFP